MIPIKLMIIVMLSAVVQVYSADQRELNGQLYKALLNGASLEGIKDLIEEHGADIKRVREHSLFGTSALHHVAKTTTQDSSVMLYLIGRGADVNAKDNDGITACHYAAACNRADFIEILFKNSADVNAKNKYGSTPLHSACASGSLNAAEVLLECGAKRQEKDAGGKTPSDVARAHDHAEIANLIANWQEIPQIKQPEED